MGASATKGGLYPLSAIEARMKRRKHADEFADTLKIASILPGIRSVG